MENTLNGYNIITLVSGYNSRMEDIPKLWQAATGDQFFLLDDSHDFWDELKGEHNYMS